MENNDINIKEPLSNCLRNFNGAEVSNEKSRKDSLLTQFKILAQKMIYGGYIRVRNDYAIFINTVEFYYHEEEGSIKDDIVYHRNGRWEWDSQDGNSLPYFPAMTLHAHSSGIDITFEDSEKHYRASALIRKYVVYDIKNKKFVKIDTSDKNLNSPDEKYKKVGKICYDDEIFVDLHTHFLPSFHGYQDSTLPSDHRRWRRSPT